MSAVIIPFPGTVLSDVLSDDRKKELVSAFLERLPAHSCWLAPYEFARLVSFIRTHGKERSVGRGTYELKYKEHSITYRDSLWARNGEITEDDCIEFQPYKRAWRIYLNAAGQDKDCLWARRGYTQHMVLRNIRQLLKGSFARVGFEEEAVAEIDAQIPMAGKSSVFFERFAAWKQQHGYTQSGAEAQAR